MKEAQEAEKQASDAVEARDRKEAEEIEKEAKIRARGMWWSPETLIFPSYRMIIYKGAETDWKF